MLELNKMLLIALILVILFAAYYSVTSENLGYKIKMVEVEKIAVDDKGIYIVKVSGVSPSVEMINSWNVTLGEMVRPQEF